MWLYYTCTSADAEQLEMQSGPLHYVCLTEEEMFLPVFRCLNEEVQEMPLYSLQSLFCLTFMQLGTTNQSQVLLLADGMDSLKYTCFK